MSTQTSRTLRQMAPPNRGAYMIHEACAYLGGISPITLRRLIDRGLVRRHPAIRHILISKVELDRFLARSGNEMATGRSSPRKTKLFPRVNYRSIRLTRFPSEMTRNVRVACVRPFGGKRRDSVRKVANTLLFGGKRWQRLASVGGLL